MHKLAIPISSKELGREHGFIHSYHYWLLYVQTEPLDENLPPQMPPFTKSELTDNIVELIVSKDQVGFSYLSFLLFCIDASWPIQAFQLVDEPSFYNFLKY